MKDIPSSSSVSYESSFSPILEGEGRRVLARFPRRLAAVVYDGLVLAGVLIVVSGLATGATALVLGAATVQATHPLQGNFWFQVGIIGVCFLFYGGFWTFGGQTLGMRAWRLRVQQANGHSPSCGQAVRRFLSGSIWLLPMWGVHQFLKPGIAWSLVIGLAALLGVLALRIPDRWSGTELVVLPPPPTS